jgi:hypothetical protein
LPPRAPQEVARIKAVIAEACGKPAPDRGALRTVSDIAVGRLEGIIGQVDVLRGEAA